jgi:hypothetical protein
VSPIRWVLHPGTGAFQPPCLFIWIIRDDKCRAGFDPLVAPFGVRMISSFLPLVSFLSAAVSWKAQRQVPVLEIKMKLANQALLFAFALCQAIEM